MNAATAPILGTNLKSRYAWVIFGVYWNCTLRPCCFRWKPGKTKVKYQPCCSFVSKYTTFTISSTGPHNPINLTIFFKPYILQFIIFFMISTTGYYRTNRELSNKIHIAYVWRFTLEDISDWKLTANGIPYSLSTTTPLFYLPYSLWTTLLE